MERPDWPLLGHSEEEEKHIKPYHHGHFVWTLMTDDDHKTMCVNVPGCSNKKGVRNTDSTDVSYPFLLEHPVSKLCNGFMPLANIVSCDTLTY